MKDYSFSSFGVWVTQGGGLVKKVDDEYVFIEAPKGTKLKIGDKMPADWDTEPANRMAMHLDSPWPSGTPIEGTLSDGWKKPSGHSRGIIIVVGG